MNGVRKYETVGENEENRQKSPAGSVFCDRQVRLEYKPHTGGYQRRATRIKYKMGRKRLENDRNGVKKVNYRKFQKSSK